MLDGQAQAIPYVRNETKIAFFIYESRNISFSLSIWFRIFSSEMGGVGKWRLRFKIKLGSLSSSLIAIKVKLLSTNLISWFDGFLNLIYSA